MNVFWVETCCLIQCARFSLRHIRYLIVFLGIWGPSLLKWRERRVVRVAFVTLQWIDDLLDGDRKSKREPLEVIDALLDGSLNDSLARLTRVLFTLLNATERETFIALVREMRSDRVRVLDREIWSAHEIDDHLRRTFTLSIDLMLSVTRCRARANDVPSLIDALAWCSTFRDLDEDRRKGLDNVPRDVDIETWTRERHARAIADLTESKRQIDALDDPQSRKILMIFQRSIERFASRFAEAHHHAPLLVP